MEESLPTLSLHVSKSPVQITYSDMAAYLEVL